MKNIVTTIPKSKYRSWKECEFILSRCLGEEDPRSFGYWLVNTMNLPKSINGESICYMLYDGMIRGYLDIVDQDLSENYRGRHNIGRRRTTKCLVLANWHPIVPVLMVGFQGWRYTELRP